MSFGIQPGLLSNSGKHSIPEYRREVSAFYGHTVHVQRSKSCPALSQAYDTTENPAPASYSTENIALLKEPEKSSAPVHQWLPLFNMDDIKNALNERSAELNYSDLMEKLAGAYHIDFTKLSELLPRNKCETSDKTDPRSAHYFPKESPFYNVYFDNYFNLINDDHNLKENLSKIYLSIKMLEAERTLVNLDIQLPACSESPTESHETDQELSANNQLTAKAKAAIGIFFIDLLNHFSVWKRADFQNDFSVFIHSQFNSHLQQDLLTFFPFVTNLWKYRESNNKTGAEHFLSESINSLPSAAKIQKYVYKCLFEIIFSKESSDSEQYKYELYDLDKNWTELQTELSYIWSDQAETDSISADPPALTLSLINDTDIPLITTSKELQSLLVTSSQRLTFNFQDLVQAFAGFNRHVPCIKTQKPIDCYISNLPQTWQPLKQSYFAQRHFHNMDRIAVFLLTRLSEAVLKVTGIPAYPPNYEDAISRPSHHDNASLPASQNTGDLNLHIQAWQIKKEFVQSLHQSLVNYLRLDLKRALENFCRANGYDSLLPQVKVSSEPVNHQHIPGKTGVSTYPAVRRINNVQQEKQNVNQTIPDASTLTNQAASKQPNAHSSYTPDNLASMAPYCAAPGKIRLYPHHTEQSPQSDQRKQKTDDRCIIA